MGCIFPGICLLQQDMPHIIRSMIYPLMIPSKEQIRTCIRIREEKRELDSTRKEKVNVTVGVIR